MVIVAPQKMAIACEESLSATLARQILTMALQYENGCMS